MKDLILKIVLARDIGQFLAWTHDLMDVSSTQTFTRSRRDEFRLDNIRYKYVNSAHCLRGLSFTDVVRINGWEIGKTPQQVSEIEAIISRRLSFKVSEVKK